MTGAPATVDKLIIIGKVLVRLPNGVEEKMMRSGRRKTPRVGESVRVSSHGEISPQMEILAEKIQVAARRRIYVKCGPKTLQPGHTGFRFKETEKERWLVITLEGDNNYDVKGLSGISENELAELKEILVSQGVPEMEEKNHMQVEPITVSVAPPVANRTAEKLVEPDQNLPDRSEEDLRLGFLIAVGEHGELQDDGRYLSKKTLVKAIPYCFEINANSSHQLYMSAIGRINWMLDRWPDIEIEKRII